MTKWCFLLLEQKGAVQCLDIDGPAIHSETFDVNETSPLIFTNIPIQADGAGFEAYLKFSQVRQEWVKQKLTKKSGMHILDQLTDVEDQREKQWLHPAATLSTVGAYHINLTSGNLDLKEGQGPLTKSDAILRFSLAQKGDATILKAPTQTSRFEIAWKTAGEAQALFDQGKYEEAYHKLQMAHTLMPVALWKDILKFYQCVWDFKFVTSNQELALIYKELKKLHVPKALQDHWYLLTMRYEKRLGLMLTVQKDQLSAPYWSLFDQEKLAPRPLFTTWMKLLYPRLEIMEVFSPHQK